MCDDVTCGPGGTCSPNPGYPDFNSYVCSCNTPGYVLNSNSASVSFRNSPGDCLDINECFENGRNGDLTNCGAHGRCSTPHVNSYRCTCNDGYFGGTTTDAPTICVDRNECWGWPVGRWGFEIVPSCGVGATCLTPEVGSYVCSCDAGFSGDDVTEGPAICTGILFNYGHIL